MRALFLDGESLVLQGIARSLAFAPEHWMLEFCTSGEQALEAMRAASYDIVVSDLKLPDMHGSKVLEAFLHESPNTLRVIFSGYADEHAALKSLDLAQQYLVKPCGGEALIALIRAQEDYLSAQHDPELTKLIGSLRRLPPAPSAVKMFSGLAEDDDLDAIVEVAARDPSLTATIIRIANSAYFRPAEPILDLHTAAVRLGTDTLKTLLLAAGVFRHEVFGDDAKLDEFSDRAVRAVGIASALSDNQADPVLLSSTLLADIGRVVLHCNGYSQTPERSQPDADQHAAIGAHLLQVWGLPENIVAYVRYHHQPQAAPSELDKSCLLRVHIAVSLSNGEAICESFIQSSDEGSALLTLAQTPSRVSETSHV